MKMNATCGYCHGTLRGTHVYRQKRYCSTACVLIADAIYHHKHGPTTLSLFKTQPHEIQNHHRVTAAIR